MSQRIISHPQAVSVSHGVDECVKVTYNEGRDQHTYRDATVALDAVRNWFESQEGGFCKLMLAVSRLFENQTDTDPVESAYDALSAIVEAQSLLARGWSEPDVLAWCKLTEGICNLDENRALSKKREIASRYS